MGHKVAPAFVHSSGPKTAAIAIVGEAWGESEDLVGKPFIGSSGQELTKLLREAGIQRRDCFLTNTFNLRPADNNMENLCVKKAELPKDYTHAPLKTGHYIKPEYLGEVERLREELVAVAPNLVIALGNTACWALLGSGKISSIRGNITTSSLIPGQKVIPSYHPAAVLRNWAYRPIVLVDLLKAEREAKFPEVIRPQRWITINPSIADIFNWVQRKAQSYSVDIETLNKTVTMIGFARTVDDAIVIPFFCPQKGNYWSTPQEEVMAWNLVQGLLASPVPKTFQNGLYDLSYLIRMGLVVKNCVDDTMLHHHALMPEMQKGLGFLGSVYTNEASWKLMRHNESNKRDE